MNLHRYIAAGLFAWTATTAQIALAESATDLGARMGAGLGTTLRQQAQDEAGQNQRAAEQLGISGFSATGKPGETSNISVERTQERALPCSSGADVGLAGARVLVESCTKDERGMVTEFTASLCDATSYGRLCYDENIESFSAPVSVAIGDDVATTFSGHPLEAAYAVSVWCDEPEGNQRPECTLRVTAGQEGEFGHADERQRADAAVQAAADHMLHSLADIRKDDEFKRLEVESEAHGDHFPTQVASMYGEGIIRSLDGNSLEVSAYEDCETGGQQEVCQVNIPTKVITCEAGTKNCEVVRREVTKTCQGERQGIELRVERRAGGCFNGSCITYITLEATSNASDSQLQDAWEWLYAQVPGCPNIPGGTINNIHNGTVIAFAPNECRASFWSWLDANTIVPPVEYPAIREWRIIAGSVGSGGTGGGWDYSVCEPYEKRSPDALDPESLYEHPLVDDVAECYLASEDNDAGVRTYTCYGEPDNSCNVDQLEEQGWSLAEISGYTYPNFPDYNDKPAIRWTEHWVSEGLTCPDDPGFGCGEAFDISDTSAKKRCYTGLTPSCGRDGGSLYLRDCVADQDGICIRQEQTWLYGSNASCEAMPGLKAAEVPFNEGAFSKALAMSEMIDQIAEHGSFDENGVFRLFTGRSRECQQLTGTFHNLMRVYSAAITAVATYFGGPLGAALAGAGTGGGMSVLEAQYCCKADPGQIDTSMNFGYCSESDIDLAAARLGKRAVQVTPGSVKTNNSFCWSVAPNIPASGDFSHSRQICNHWTRPWSALNVQIHVDTYQRWCEYDSMLGRIIQEQGREQLRELAAMGAGGAQTGTKSFPFFGRGGWTDPIWVNGNTIRFWQWNEACEDEAAQAALAFSDLMACPAEPDVYVAICEQANCSAPPHDPVYHYESDWEVHQVRAENHGLHALTRYVVLEGGCFEDGGCDYKAHAWQAGKGGQLRISLDMDWPLTGFESGWESRIWSHNNVHFRPYIFPQGASDPKPRLQMCVGDPESCSWEEITVPDPVTDLEHVVHSSPRVTLLGQCRASGNCQYRATIHINLTAKPWYTYSEKKYRPCMLRTLGKCVTRGSTTYDRQYIPHCEGFTLDEFLALDFNRMDLAEYIETLSTEAKKEFNELWQ